MGDSFTNFLLITLITLLAFIGKMFYEKLTTLIGEIRAIMLSDVANKKDIDNLKQEVREHDGRISFLERNKNNFKQ